MKFQEPIRNGHFLKRYKRFFADIEYGGGVVTAMVPNTGSLKTCLFDKAPCVFTENNDPKRKLKATLQFIETPTGWVGVNTGITNGLVFEAWSKGLIPDWAPFKAAKREYKISKESRLDLVLAPTDTDLENGKKLCFIEIKNVTFCEDGDAKFPDAVTTRGQKHLRDLMRLRAEGHRAEIVFVVQREDCCRFAPADEIDPDYGHLLREAIDAGVVARALKCEIDPTLGVRVTGEELPIIIGA